MIGLLYRRMRQRREWRAVLSAALRAAALVLFAVLFFWAANPYGEVGAAPAEVVAGREFIPRDIFLMMDPFATIAAAVASRALTIALVPALAVLALNCFWPRLFCAGLCPLGALIDVTDAILWPLRRIVGERRPRPLRHVKYVLLAAGLVSAIFGVSLAGQFAAMPALTRAMAFGLHPLDVTIRQGHSLVPDFTGSAAVWIAAFGAVLALGAVKRRFWCTYLCPTGALLATLSPARLWQRRVAESCVECGNCLRECPFDAVAEDFHTIHSECALCGACAEVCPPGAIEFPRRGAGASAAGPVWSPTLSRRTFIAGGAAGVAGAVVLWRSASALGPAAPFVRPPGAVPEGEFLASCVRCGSCYRSCPGQVLQPLSLSEGGLAAFWTPRAVAAFAACRPECNNCGTACPTGAVRALPLDEKRCAKMGTARVNAETCVMCGACAVACADAGYDAIDFGGDGKADYAPPAVRSDWCVGCGACERACRYTNVEGSGALAEPAIEVTPAGAVRLSAPGSFKADRERRVRAFEEAGAAGEGVGREAPAALTRPHKERTWPGP